jgi:hypothetical protein
LAWPSAAARSGRANNVGDQVWRLDPHTGSVLSVAHVGDAHEFVGFSDGRVWVANDTSGTVSRIALGYRRSGTGG